MISINSKAFFFAATSSELPWGSGTVAAGARDEQDRFRKAADNPAPHECSVAGSATLEVANGSPEGAFACARPSFAAEMLVRGEWLPGRR